MKKILVFLTIILSLVSCEPDDSGKALNADITVGQEHVAPNLGVYTNMQFDGTDRVGRYFRLNRSGLSSSEFEIVININYPASGGNGDGTYFFTFAEQDELTATGYVIYEGKSYIMSGGSFQFADLGSDKFSFDFDNTYLIDTNSGETEDFDAEINGKFTYLEED